jgi:hypothetical protein
MRTVYRMTIVYLLNVVMLLAAAQPSTSSEQQGMPAAPPGMTAAEIAALVAETGRRTTLMTIRIYDYTYTLTETIRSLDKRGRVKREEVKVYETYPSRGRRREVKVLISENGVRRSDEKIERERRRAGEDLADAEREADARNRRLSHPQAGPANQAPSYFFSFGVYWKRLFGEEFGLYPTDFLTSHEFFAPRRATFESREAIVLSLRPRPEAEAGDGSGRVRARLAGTIWIDAVDKVIMRLEAFPAQEIVRPAIAPDENAPVAFEMARLADGTWLPRSTYLNTYGREAVFNKFKINLILHYSDHKLFSTNVEQERIDAPLSRP